MNKDYERCKLISKEYRLEMNDIGLNVLSEAGAPFGALVLSGIVVSVTAVVSSSIIMVGNTVHFLKKQGSCDDSFLNQQILNYITPLLNDVGELIEHTDAARLQ